MITGAIADSRCVGFCETITRTVELVCIFLNITVELRSKLEEAALSDCCRCFGSLEALESIGVDVRDKARRRSVDPVGCDRSAVNQAIYGDLLAFS